MSAASRLRSLMPVLGMLMAASLLWFLKPMAVLPRVMGTLGAFLLLLWLLHPVAYGRVQALMEHLLQGLVSLITLPVLLLAYFLLLTPIAVLLRLRGRDPLNGRRSSPATTTEWRQPQPRPHDEEFFRVQF